MRILNPTEKRYYLKILTMLLVIKQGILGHSTPVKHIGIHLQKAFLGLSQYLQKKTSIANCSDCYAGTLTSLNTVTYRHPRIISCKKIMEKKHTVYPLINLWREPGTSYLLYNDESFLRDFLMLIYECSGELVVTMASVEEPEKARSITNNIISVYEKLESLPIEELVNAIDVVAEELPYLLEKYEFHTDITWKEWFNKYWWVPPLIVGTLFLRIWVQHLLWKRMNQFQFYQNYHEEYYAIPHDNS